ncbi:tyrosine-type recombinase/integrase [Pseudomonas sp.]|uniref:tyrosine-type recombinase/integrase n=1 Tax=Pseudomonas sp. TaxID=306 RepID=UPI004053F37E
MPLTDVQIRQAKPGEKPRKLSDERGLFIEIRPAGSKLWRYRYKIDGVENVFAIGEYPEMGLADARAERDRARALVKQGRHPAHVRRIQRVKQQLENQSSFKVVALEWIASKSNISDSYRNQLTRAFTRNLFPYIGRFPIRDVSAAHLLECLRRMESRGGPHFMRSHSATGFHRCFASQSEHCAQIPTPPQHYMVPSCGSQSSIASQCPSQISPGSGMACRPTVGSAQTLLHLN